MTGQHAFPATSPLDTAQGILIKEPIPPSSVNPYIPAHLDLLIRSMLAKVPDDRPTAMQVARTLRELQVRERTAALSLWKWATIALVSTLVCFALWRWRQARAQQNMPAFRQITTLLPENRATAAAISPDGKLAAYANVDGIFIREIESGETSSLSGPGDFTVDRMAWFPDGAKIAVSGFSTVTNIPSIWIVSLTTQPPHLLREHARAATPSPDGSRIEFISQDRSEIWVISATGTEPQRILSGQLGDRFPIVWWSPDGRRLFFQRHHFSSANTSVSNDSVLLATGKAVTIGPNLWMSSVAALPDGRIQFLRWDNDNFTSSRQLWELKTDPKTGAFLQKPSEIAALPVDDTTLLDLSVTADGKRAIVLRRSDQNSVFLGDFDHVAPRITNIRRLTLDEGTNYPHAWTADSRAIIFESNRNGNFDLFKQNINRRTPEIMVATSLTEILAQLSPDGRFVLYAARPHEDQQPWYYKPGTYKLMRVPVDGGTPEEVPIDGPLDEFRCALGYGKRCVLRNSVEGQYRAFYDLDPIRGKGRELARTKSTIEVLGDWDISPDGTHVAIPNHDSREARIRVVTLDPGPHDIRERDVVLPGITDLRGLVWAADGGGWFVSVDTTVGNRMLYVYLDGRFKSLGDIQGWAVPSPDGRRVAFLDRIVATNAWLLDRKK